MDKIGWTSEMCQLYLRAIAGQQEAADAYAAARYFTPWPEERGTDHAAWLAYVAAEYQREAAALAAKAQADLLHLLNLLRWYRLDVLAVLDDMERTLQGGGQ